MCHYNCPACLELSRLLRKFNPVALKMAKTPWSFGHFECKKVNVKRMYVQSSRLEAIFENDYETSFFYFSDRIYML